jgi:hypothetical protein
MNGTCGPRNGYQHIAISPAVGGAAVTSPLRLEFVIASGVHPLLLGW